MATEHQQDDSWISGAALVVAHPNDEILWFSGVLAQVRQIVVCFGHHPRQESVGLARSRVRERYPFSNVTWLDLMEPMSFGTADWRKPVPTPEGLQLTRGSAVRKRYRSAYEQVKDALTRELAPYTNIITHNPWGEYGHEELVLVHRAVVASARSRNQRVWHSNYCGSRSISLAERYLAGMRASEQVTRDTSLELIRKMQEMYIDEMWWTWTPIEDWFSHETYCEARGAAEERPSRGKGFALNFIGGAPPSAGGWRARGGMLPRLVQRLTRPLQPVAARLGIRQRLNMPDRLILEERIMPHLVADESVRDILFVGVDWYTKWYRELFRAKNWITMDVDARKAPFGSPRHIVDRFENLPAHASDESFDAIICNGVFGHGLDDIPLIERTFESCWRALRPGGQLILGWNDVAPHRPIRLEDIQALKRFARPGFPPLATSRHRVTNTMMRHTFDFYVKA